MPLFELTNEKDNEPSAYREHIENIRGDIHGLTIHCMEVAGPERGFDALTLKPDRIGHGIRMTEDPKLIERFANAQVPVEVCLHSNVVSGTVTNAKAYPILAMLKAGIPIIIGSDGANDSSTLRDNYRLVQETFAFTDTEMNEFRQRSVNEAFRNKYPRKPSGSAI